MSVFLWSFLRRRVHDIRLCPRADGQPRSAPWWPLVVTASSAAINNSQGPNWMERVLTLTTDRPARHQTVPRRGLSLRLKMSKCNISTLSAPANANVQLLILKTELLMENAVGFLKNWRLSWWCALKEWAFYGKEFKKISVCFFISGALLNIIENMVVYQKMYIVVYLTLLHSWVGFLLQIVFIFYIMPGQYWRYIFS